MIDTLVMARKKHPGQRNSLDALCKRYDVDNSQRDLHGALLDAEILADVYLLMTGGQTILQLQNEEDTQQEGEGTHRERDLSRGPLLVTQPSHADMLAHEQFLDRINKQSNNACVWSAVQHSE